MEMRIKSTVEEPDTIKYMGMYLSFGQSWKLRNPKSKANQKLKTNLDSWKLGLEILTAHAHYKIQSDFLRLKG